MIKKLQLKLLKYICRKYHSIVLKEAAKILIEKHLQQQFLSGNISAEEFLRNINAVNNPENFINIEATLESSSGSIAKINDLSWIQ